MGAVGFNESEWIWRDGEFIRWQDAQIHILATAVQFGTSVFEGMRSYATPKGPAIFRLDAHIKRLFDSARVYRMLPDYTQENMCTVESAPCRPRYEPRLLTAGMCYPCHEPTHDAFTEYKTSNAFAVGVRCVDCHMQPTKHRRGRSHGNNGGLNPDFVKRALGWRCWLENNQVHVELRNRCGHKFPGEIPSRSFIVRVTFPGSDPEREPIHVLLRKSHRGEDRKDNRLRPDETRILRFPLPKGATKAEVRLLFKPLPMMTTEQSFVLGKWSSSL